MPNLFRDDIVSVEKYELSLKKDIFTSILKLRKNQIDEERFFLKYISPEDLKKYNFDDSASLKEFRNLPFYRTPIKGMGGCNLREEFLEKDIVDGGKKMSDPEKRILGQFDIRNRVMTYCPFFAFFYEQRDVTKFAYDVYFTTLSFETILMNQLEHVKKCYVHTGYYHDIKDIVKYGSYIFEEIEKDEMKEYITNPELGRNIVMKRHLKI